MKAFFIIAIAFIIASCAENKNTTEPENEGLTEQPNELKVGGLYLLKKSDTTFYLTKIIALDDFAVHLRTYQDTFRIKPTDVDSENLKVLIGHAPLDINGFLISNPELIKVEKVKEAEMEGYKIYLEAMGN